MVTNVQYYSYSNLCFFAPGVLLINVALLMVFLLYYCIFFIMVPMHETYNFLLSSTNRFVLKLIMVKVQ